MPGKHNNDTKLLGFFADVDLVHVVDQQRGGIPRSQFLRDAVVEYMINKGVKIPDRLRYGPDRTGKGGRKESSNLKKPSRARETSQIFAAAERADRKS